MALYNAGRHDKQIFKNTAAHGKAINIYNRIWRGGIRL